MASSGYGQDEWWLCKLRSGRRGEYARDVLERGYCVVDGIVEAELVAACGREGCALRESALDSAQCAGGPLATRARGVELLEGGDLAVRPSAQPLAASRRLAEQIEAFVGEVRSACALASGPRAGWGLSGAAAATGESTRRQIGRRCVLARGAGDGDRIRLRVAARGAGRDLSYICFVGTGGSAGVQLGSLATAGGASVAKSTRIAATAGRVIVFVDVLPLLVERPSPGGAGGTPLVVAGWSALRSIVNVTPALGATSRPSSPRRPGTRGGEQNRAFDRRRQLRVTMLRALLRAGQLKAVADAHSAAAAQVSATPCSRNVSE